jgi:capsular polysaccharide biosynthesis protein
MQEYTLEIWREMKLTKMKMLTIAITFIFSLVGIFFFQTPTYAKNTSIHVHLRGDTSQVESVAVIHKGETIQLERKSGKLYSVKKPAEIVKPDVSDIIVTLSGGTVLTFSPAINYAGTEGKGTINYWVEIKVSEETTTEPSKDSDKEKEKEDSTKQSNSDSNKKEDKGEVDSSKSNTSENNTATEVTKTISGGKLPETGAPWYNILLASALGLITSCFVLYRSSKQD